MLTPAWRRKVLAFAASWIVAIFLLSSFGGASSPPAARLVIVMVWDGLRPDSVTKQTTPNLYALQHQGAYFADHHSMFPTLTMVNGATIATASPPAVNGLISNVMYFGQLLDGVAPRDNGLLALAHQIPMMTENTKFLKALDGPGGLRGGFLQVPSLAQQLIRSGGLAAIVGKSGPTYLFDDDIEASAADGRALFASDDQADPQALAQELQDKMNPESLKSARHEDPPFGDQDAHLAQVFIEHALPAGAAALKANHSALLVFWQHNPDISQHATGLGTAADLKALAICDANLGKLREAIAKLGISGQTDLIVVSDHGFATIKAEVDLTSLLVAQGLKKSLKSDDVVLATNVGVDNIYLSPRLDSASRTDLMQRIVNYAESQEWCGPIFSRPPDGVAHSGYMGAIAGTFDQAWFGLFNPNRSPDLIISFREIDEEDNSHLGGSQAKAFLLDATGTHLQPNHSQPAVRTMPGVAYADGPHTATTGDGTHGSLGRYQIHNFCAAIGPDFRRGWVDKSPTSNLDLGRTLAALLRVRPAASPCEPAGYGRVMTEALNDAVVPQPSRSTPVSVTLKLPSLRVTTTIEVEQKGTEKYLSGSEVHRSNAVTEQPTWSSWHCDGIRTPCMKNHAPDLLSRGDW